MSYGCPACGDHRVSEILDRRPDGCITVRCKLCEGIYQTNPLS